MPNSTWSALLDLPAFPANGYARLADRIGALLKTRNDVLLVQGEAIIALEAVAASLAAPSLKALNIVTSPYGKLFGDWLRRGGTRALDVTAEPGKPIGFDAVKAAFDANPDTQIVSLVHAESASGILNPLPEIACLARERGALVVLDAVASVGGHALDVDGLGVDIAVIGAQKSLGGSSGLSALSVSPEAWRLIDRPDGLAASNLSILDLKRNWLDTGRGQLPGMPSALEFFALQAALDRIEAEGMDAVVARHALAGKAARNGLRALGVPLWADEDCASNLVTSARAPEGVDIAALLAHPACVDAGLTPGAGDMADRLARLNHTGPRARYEVVLASVLALGLALRAHGMEADLSAAADAVTRVYAA